MGEATVRSAAAGDEAAFAQLIERHNSAMARVAYVIAGDREATLDAVQSAWTIAWRKLSAFATLIRSSWSNNQLPIPSADGSNEQVLWTGDFSTAEDPDWGP